MLLTSKIISRDPKLLSPKNCRRRMQDEACEEADLMISPFVLILVTLSVNDAGRLISVIMESRSTGFSSRLISE